MQPMSQFSSDSLAHKASTPKSPVAQFEEPNYSPQAIQPGSQFNSCSLAHKALAPKSPAAQFDELDYSAQTMQPKSQFSSGYSAHKDSAPGAQQLSLTSTTTLLKPCSLIVSSAQAIQPVWPQRPEPSSSV